MAKKKSNRDAKPRKLPAGLWKRGNVYYARFSHNGRQIRERLHTDKRVAQEMLAELRVKKHRREVGTVTNDYPLGTLLDEWHRSISQTIAPPTASRYACQVRTLNRLIPVRTVAAMDTEHIEVYRAERLDEGVSAATVNHEVNILTTALDWGVNRKKIGSTPVAELKRLPHDPKEARPLTLEEVDQFLAASERPLWRNVWYAYLTTGLRKMELARLIWSDIDWPARELIVRAPGAQTKPARRIPIDAELYRILTAQCEGRNKRRPGGEHGNHDDPRLRRLFTRNHVFVSPLDTPLNRNIYRQFISTCRRAGIENRTVDADGNTVEFVGVHSLRHTFCTHLIMTGESPKSAQELMGHKTLEMTMNIYTKVFPKNKRAAIDRLPCGAGPAEAPDVLRMQR